MENLYLGQNINYWLELKRKAEELNVVDFIKEIADLRAKVSYYESRIQELNNFSEKFRELK